MPKKLTTEQCIERAKIAHNNFYDYSKVVYVNDRIKICIICPIHGEFMQSYLGHVRSQQGCPTCSIARHKQRMKGSFDPIVLLTRCKDKNVKLLLETYTGAHTNIDCVCTVHNYKFSTPVDNIRVLPRLCPKCQKEHVNVPLQNKRREAFLQRVSRIHNNKYTYDLSNYKSNKTKISIYCPTQGLFEQIAGYHASGNGCQICCSSRGEENIKSWLDNHDIKYVHQHRVTINKSHHYYDFYIPSLNYIIEFNGLQHYKPINFFGGIKALQFTSSRDLIKQEYCKQNKINMLIISYYDIKNIDRIIDSVLMQKMPLLNCNNHTKNLLHI